MQRLSPLGKAILVAWSVAVVGALTLTVFNFTRALQIGEQPHDVAFFGAKLFGGLMLVIPALGVWEETFRADVLAPLAAFVLRLASGGR